MYVTKTGRDNNAGCDNIDACDNDAARDNDVGCDNGAARDNDAVRDNGDACDNDASIYSLSTCHSLGSHVLSLEAKCYYISSLHSWRGRWSHNNHKMLVVYLFHIISINFSLLHSVELLRKYGIVRFQNHGMFISG